MSSVVTPGATIARSSARMRATRWPALRSFSISLWDRQTIIASSPATVPSDRLLGSLHRHAGRRRIVDQRVHLVRHALRCLRAVDDAEGRPFAVVLEHGT